jgi:hypothetical protein
LLVVKRHPFAAAVPAGARFFFVGRIVSAGRGAGFRTLLQQPNLHDWHRVAAQGFGLPPYRSSGRGSTFPAMCEFLAAPGDCVSVVSLPTNPGPRHIFADSAAFALLPRHFCVTDPDLAFNPAMPSDFLGDLAALAAREQSGKVGLALDISDHEAMHDESFLIRGQRWRIWEWEEQFWRDELSPLRPGGDPVYRAQLDTTFALYDRNFFSPACYLEALRVAGRFTCQHLPWRRDMQLPKEEEQFYNKTQKFSYYIRDRGSEPSHVI